MPGERNQVDHIIAIRANQNLALQETLALGLMALDKWDRADQASGTTQAAAANAAAHDNFTPQAYAAMRDSAARMLLTHAASMGEPAWWPAILQGFASAWLYSFSIAIIAVMIKLSGSGDLISLLRDLLGHSGG